VRGKICLTHMSEKTPPDFAPDPYADYASLLSPDFTPSSHANSLVVATNDPSDKQIDLTSPLKRIEYDIEEVNRRIDQLVYSYYDTGLHTRLKKIVKN